MIKKDDAKKIIIEYYYVYDSCYRGNVGSEHDGFPRGSGIYNTFKKSNAQRMVDIMNVVAEKENKLKLQIGKESIMLDALNIENMSDEEIIKWVKNK